MSKNAYYLDSVTAFLKDVERNLFVNRMKKGGKLSPDLENAEVVSWRENAKIISKLLRSAELNERDDVYIAFEYAAPVGGRVDCVLFGSGKDGKKNIILLELKQWGNQLEIFSGYGKNWIEVFVGGSIKTVDHPSEQAERYEIHFRNFINLFDCEEYQLSSIAYCYNYENYGNKSGLFDEVFAAQLERNALYAKNMTDILAKFLNEKLSKGDGCAIAEAIENAEYKPTRALIDAAANMMINSNDNTFVLLGDQDDAYKKFWSVLKKSFDKNEKSVFIVKGGPGTGKTVIALKILSELYKEAQKNGEKCSAYYATRSTALTKQLAEAIKGASGCRKKATGGAQDLIKKTNDFRPACFRESEIDVLLVDEAHRVQNSSNDQSDRITKAVVKKGTPIFCPLNQTMSLIYCAKVTVFFIDDHQAVKNQEIGSSKDIEYFARNYDKEYTLQIAKFKKEYEKSKPKNERKIQGWEEELKKDITDEKRKKIIKDINKARREISHIKGLDHLTEDALPTVSVYKTELQTQFRCLGADRFVQWLDNILYNDVPNENKIRLDKEDFDFQIINTPQELEQKIRALNNQDSEPKVSARLVAGWCWDWDKKTAENGDLKREVEIGDWAMPWETKARPTKEYKERYARNADFWARDAQGINQVGCIYSAQGFEFDYVGVILGPDIKYDAAKDSLVCIPNLNKEKNLTDKNSNGELLIRNIYKVLLTRGRKGCFMYSCDPEVSRYFKRFMNY